MLLQALLARVEFASPRIQCCSALFRFLRYLFLLLLERLSGVAPAERTARFRCVMVYLPSAQSPAPLICEATWEGHIAESASGDGGFGYDPLFLPAGERRSSAELAPAEKNRLSHRGQALRLLVASLAGERPRTD